MHLQLIDHLKSLRLLHIMIIVIIELINCTALLRSLKLVHHKYTYYISRSQIKACIVFLYGV